MFYIIRHGQTDANLQNLVQGQNDVPLNDDGRAQAHDAATQIVSKNIKVKRIISSDLSRTAETAQIIGNKLNISVEYDARLREYNFGNLTGLKQTQLDPELVKTVLTKPNENGAESIPDMFARVGNFLGELDMNQDILVVSHGGTMRFIMHYLENNGKIDTNKFIQSALQIHIKNAQLFVFLHGKFEPVK